MNDAPIHIREAIPGDEPFIFQSWLRTYRYHSPFAKKLSEKTYYARHHVVVTRILKQATVLIACLPDDRDTILGYLVLSFFEDKPVIHFCYVKNSFRRLGIASRLIQASGVDLNDCCYTHRTYAAAHWIENKAPGLVYDPYLI